MFEGLKSQEMKGVPQKMMPHRTLVFTRTMFMNIDGSFMAHSSTLMARFFPFALLSLCVFVLCEHTTCLSQSEQV